MNLKDHRTLSASPVVANCRMNRERVLTGGNSYTQDLGLNPVEFLLSRLGEQSTVSWLDLCCGSGRALIESARQVSERHSEIEITGVDLVGMFAEFDGPNLSLVESPIEEWRPDRQFDLITCVHGLHYVGDKIETINRAASWLTPTGIFTGHLDPQNLKHADYKDFGRVVVRHLRDSHIEFNTRRRLLKCTGQQKISVPWQYIGADDAAGPNFTGQPAVNSWYEDFC